MIFNRVPMLLFGLEKSRMVAIYHGHQLINEIAREQGAP